MKSPILFSLLLALALIAPGPARAADFFGIPEKTVVPKPPAATPAPPATPVSATPNPAPAVPQGAARPNGSSAPAVIVSGPASEEAPTLLPDGPQLKTPSIGGQKDWGRPYRDLGPDNGILIGFEYTVGTTEQGWTVIESFTPLYLRAAGKARGTLRGTPKPGNPATVLEARPGFAVAAMEVRGGGCLDAFRITFMRYENGVLDPSERYLSQWIGGEKGEVAKVLRTDMRPIVGVYGKAGGQINEFGLLVRREAQLIAKTPASTSFFGTPVTPESVAIPPPTAEMTEDPAAPIAAPLAPAVFDPSILKTDFAGSINFKGGDYRDLAPLGGLLVGFDYAIEKTNGIKLATIAPLYMLPNGAKKVGEPHGEATISDRLEARPGYAVGAVRVHGNALVRGFQVTFMKIKGPALDPADSYTSDWIGGGNKEIGKLLDGGGQPFGGLYGKSDKLVNSLGFFVKKDVTTLVTARPGVPSLTTGALSTPGLATPAPATGGSVQIFACADDSFTLFLNGREILTGSDLNRVESGMFSIVKGDVLTAIVKDKGGGDGDAWFSLRVVRDAKTILDAGDMRYLPAETLNWKTTKLLTGFRDPKVWTHEKQMGTDPRPRAAWAGVKDAAVSVVYFKGVMP